MVGSSRSGSSASPIRNVCGPCAKAPASIAENSSANPAHSHLHKIIVPSPVDAGGQLRTILNPPSNGKGRGAAAPLAKIPRCYRAPIVPSSPQVLSRLRTANGRRERQQETRERPCLSPNDFMVVCMGRLGRTTRHKSRKASERREHRLKPFDGTAA